VPVRETGDPGVRLTFVPPRREARAITGRAPSIGDRFSGHHAASKKIVRRLSLSDGCDSYFFSGMSPRGAGRRADPCRHGAGPYLS
jgi:hypothetical protein